MKSELTHVTRVTGQIGHEDLKKIILAAVCANTSFTPYESGLSISLLALGPTDDEQLGMGLHFELVKDHDWFSKLAD